MNTDKLAVNLQNFARVRLQLKIAFIILIFLKRNSMQRLGNKKNL